MVQNQEKTYLNQFLAALQQRQKSIDCLGLNKSDKSYLISQIYRQYRRAMVVITSSHKEGQRLCEELRFFMGPQASVVTYFPAYNLIPYKFLASDNETASSRIRVLYQLAVNEGAPLIVTTLAGLMKRTLPRKQLCDYAELVMSGEEIDRENLIQKLEAGGYEHSAIVEEPGDYCVRGGILDIFSPLYQHPLRIELFGDLVDSMRFFSPLSQRTDSPIQEAIILPAKEIILESKDLPGVIGRIRQEASHLETPVTTTRKLIERLKNEGVFSGSENLMALLPSELESLWDYTSDDALYVVTGYEELKEAAATVEKRGQKSYETELAETGFAVNPDKTHLTWDTVKTYLKKSNALIFKDIAMVSDSEMLSESATSFEFKVEDNSQLLQALKHPKSVDVPLSPLIDWVLDHQKKGYLTVIVCGFSSQAERLKSMLLPYDIPLMTADALPIPGMHRKGRLKPVYICIGDIGSGFVWPQADLALITANEIFGTRRKRARTSKGRIKKQLLSFEDLKINDLVVHDDHGIGQYKGLMKLTVTSATNDFLIVAYKDDDRLYLPVDRMNRIQKYMGVEGVVPILDKMGGRSWERVKAKAKKSTVIIAKELLRLYAARKVHKGFSHRPMEIELQGFEDGFPYEETVDQRKAIEQVMHDMAQPIPMDRLICGDVGYGKTEIALRAAFVSVYNAKQVAVLVPTTVLAEQHYATFSERFKNYPVNIACLSRFRTRQEQRMIVTDLKEGKIDIVIGTHRLLQKDVAFKNLGLFVLDEEHRFGVRHKEVLKKIRTTIDVLALTATPIPRTLHMSLVGIRDIDLITTPPEFRHSVTTYISEFTDGIVRDAISRELRRGGQIFFVHNSIKSIDRMAARLKSIVPKVRLDVAHGQMQEQELEKIMQRFVNKEIDMLVCTTIIESGLDIPSANTIFINRADRFGLAQMYQLRGRVGRAEERAYAYLFIPPESYISRDALKRLKVLMDHSELGSGFQIAMNDLKLRGGGTILGASQSGHIAAIGYDMFLKLMEESVAELKGEQTPDDIEPEINLILTAFIPESYISDIDQRLSAYRRLSKITQMDEIQGIKTELMDRYGKLPEEVSNLLLKIVFKILAARAGIRKLDIKGNQLVLHISEKHQHNPHGIVDMILGDKKRYRLTPDNILTAELNNGQNGGVLNQTKYILKEIAHHVNA